MKPRIIFITGTDTGVGKTVLTGLLLHHLIQEEINVGVLKPFCSGGRDDAIQLAGVMGDPTSLDRINPYHFELPLTPLVAARMQQQRIEFDDCLKRIEEVANACDVLLIEGAGGLLSPLGEDYDALSFIREIKAQTVLVAPNRLGVLNQVFLNLNVLYSEDCAPASVILMTPDEPDDSIESNASLIRERAFEPQVHEVPFLGENPLTEAGRKESYEKTKKTLAAIMGRP